MKTMEKLTLNEIDEMNQTTYSPEKFDRDDLVHLRTWQYFDVVVPQDNKGEFND